MLRHVVLVLLVPSDTQLVHMCIFEEYICVYLRSKTYCHDHFSRKKVMTVPPRPHEC